MSQLLISRKATRAWLIDLDGTLYHASLMRAAMVFEILMFGRDMISTLRHFRGQQERMREQAAAWNPSPFDCQLAETARQLGKPIHGIRDSLEEWMVKRPQKWIRVFRRRSFLREIDRFRTSGGRTALVSDYPATAKLRALKADTLFDVVVANGEPNGPPRLKPWPDGYLAAAEGLQVEGGRCLVIGDRADTDGVAARQARMDFLHVHDWRSGL